MLPSPASACCTICGRSTTSRIAWRTRTSSNGAWSTRIVNGSQAPVLATSGFTPGVTPITRPCANGTLSIA